MAQESLYTRLNASLRRIPNYPKPGITFIDIQTMLQDGRLFRDVIEDIVEDTDTLRYNKVMGMEARGFIIGSALSYRLAVPLVLARKPGKLPGATVSVTYKKEYGTDELVVGHSMIKPGDEILIVDDLLATGGTAAAAAELVEKCGGKVAGFAFVVELSGLEGHKNLGDHPVYSCLTI
jgi:adenine phosphoribosyltransferase